MANKNRIGLLLTSACVVCAWSVGPALAQEQTPAQEPREADTRENEGQMIVVTAQRRAENLREVPISITAVSGDFLEDSGVTATDELFMVVPGLKIETTGAFVQPTIRGISTSVISPIAESSIATYIDGVYQTTQVGAIYDLPDVSTIQVLKGPQGTLFGRNATGGAILINTVEPDLYDPSGTISASYGRFDQLVLKGYVSAPIAQDRAGILLSARFENSDGYTRDLTNAGELIGGVKSYLLRGKLRVRPWDGADFVATALYNDRKDYNALLNTNFRGNNVALQTLPASQIASKPWETAANEDSFVFSEQFNISLRGDIDVGPGTLTTTTAFTRDDILFASDVDNSTIASTFAEAPALVETFQQELLYATDQFGAFRAIGGLFYYSNDGTQDLGINRDQLTIYQRDKVESYSAFGEVTVDVTDKLTLVGGLRYSHDTQDAFATIVFGPGGKPASLPKLGEATFESFTPRFSVLYELTDLTNTYFTYSEGFKAGLFNTVSFQTEPVRPEKVSAYEIGIKSEEIIGLSFSLAAFYYDYKDLQQPTADFAGVVPRQFILNAASSEIYGAEFTGNWRPTENLNLSAGLTYLDASYVSYPSAVVYVPTGSGGNALVGADVSGNRLIRSPEWSGNVVANYGIETAVGRFEAIGSAFFSSRFFLESGNRVVQPSYALLNASLGFQPAGTEVEIRIWGKNLGNQTVLAGANISATADTVIYSPPRTYGIEVGVNF